VSSFEEEGENLIIKVVGQNQGIPKDLLLNQKIIDVDFFDKTTVFYLENGYDFYFHNDSGETELIKVD
jgi:hypothetical protein